MGFLDSIKKVFSNDAGDAGNANQTAEPAQAGQSRSEDAFYIDMIETNRAEKERFFRTSPYSPIEDRASFTGLNYYPPNPDFRYMLPLQEAEKPQELIFPTSTGDEQTYFRIGTVEFEVEGQPARLAIYSSPHHDELFLPFRDATSGSETYGAGRYLEPEVLPDGNLLVDFNLAYNPFCAYSDDYSCPLPPFENHLKLPIRAGEKAYEKHNDLD